MSILAYTHNVLNTLSFYTVHYSTFRLYENTGKRFFMFWLMKRYHLRTEDNIEIVTESDN